MRHPILISAFVGALLPLAALAQSAPPPRDPTGATDPAPLVETIRQVSRHVGEMTMALDAGGADIEVTERLRFEPYQQLEEMFTRDDVVFLMRHGLTDWSHLDEKGVAPTDCAHQRVMRQDDIEKMRQLGTLLASNGIVPSRVVASEWCRNQQTLTSLLDGFGRVDPAIADAMPVETTPELNLLLSLQGSPDVAALRTRISSWSGDPDRKGPLLLISHYTNIEELTQFRVFEGEILVLDPKRDNLVLGYLRLQSAGPDVGHFKDALSSPLLDEEQAFDMVSRYYAALGSGDRVALDDVLSDGWISHGTATLDDVRNVAAFLAETREVSDGLSDAHFDIVDLYLTDDIVTVIGTVTGRHTGPIYGIPATGRTVTFGGIAVHRIREGRIVETWQMSDRLSLIRQIAG